MANENQGFLYRALDRKSDRSPTHWGHANVNGHEWKLAAWPAKEEYRKRREDISVLATDKHSNDEQRFSLDYEEADGNKPDYRGQAFDEEVVGWIKEKKQDTAYTRKGDKFLSLKFGGKKKTEKGDSGAQGADDIPF